MTAQATTAPRQQESTGSRPAPRLDVGAPLVGPAMQFQHNPLRLLEDGWRKHGELFRFNLFGKDFHAFMGPRAHETFFNAPDEVLSQQEVYQFTVPMFGKGIAYDAPPNIMAEQLGFLYPALSAKRMKHYAGIMQQEVEDYTADWGDEGEIDLPTVTNELTTRIAAHCFLGEEIRQLVDSRFARHYKEIELGVNLVAFFVPGAPVPKNRRRDKARRAITQLISEVVAERRRTGRRAEDFMQTLMESTYSDGTPLTDAEIAGILLTVLFAGQHNAAVLSAWTGVELMLHPEWIERVRGEMRDLYGTDRGDVELNLSALKQRGDLERVVKENERMHPPLIMLMRKVKQDLHHAGYRIPAGSLALVSPGAAHRLPTVFADPHRFDPDRFAPPREEDRQAQHALLGFGGGHHRCVGQNFGYMQIKAIWTTLLAHFDMELATPAPGPDYKAWVVGPEQPCRVRYRRR